MLSKAGAFRVIHAAPAGENLRSNFGFSGQPDVGEHPMKGALISLSVSKSLPCSTSHTKAYRFSDAPVTGTCAESTTRNKLWRDVDVSFNRARPCGFR